MEKHPYDNWPPATSEGEWLPENGEEPPRPEEEIADAIKESEEEIVDTAPCSIEEQYDGVIKLIDEVRQDIPEIPEIKYYDEQLEELTAYVEEVKENIPTYDVEISAICDLIDELKEEVRTNAASIPEIRYYDDQIESLESSLKSLPEIRHYEDDISSVKEDIVELREFVSNAPNYEAPADHNTDNVYEVTVTISDGTNSGSTIAYTVTVDDVSVAITQSQTGSVSEAATSGTTVMTVATTGDSAESFSIISGNSDGIFAISNAGVITISSTTNLTSIS